MTRLVSKRAQRSKRTRSDNVRVVAAQLLSDLIAQHGNLSTLLDSAQASISTDQRPLLQEMSYGTARHLQTLEFLAQQRLKKTTAQ